MFLPQAASNNHSTRHGRGKGGGLSRPHGSVTADKSASPLKMAHRVADQASRRQPPVLGGSITGASAEHPQVLTGTVLRARYVCCVQSYPTANLLNFGKVQIQQDHFYEHLESLLTNVKHPI